MLPSSRHDAESWSCWFFVLDLDHGPHQLGGVGTLPDEGVIRVPIRELIHSSLSHFSEADVGGKRTSSAGYERGADLASLKARVGCFEALAREHYGVTEHCEVPTEITSQVSILQATEIENDQWCMRQAKSAHSERAAVSGVRAP